MKKLIIILLLSIAGFAGSAQGIGYGYTYIAQRYNWLAGVFNALGLPAGDSPAFQSGQYQRAGALYYDSTGVDSGLYVWSGLAWREVGSGSGTPLVNTPLFLTGDTINIREASAIDSGYLSSGNFAKFDSLANNWVRVGNYLYPANITDSVIIGATPTTPHLFNLEGNMYFNGDIYTSATLNRRLLNFQNQNLFFGERSGNTMSSGAENTGIGELALNDITSGVGNTAIGKDAGSAVTSGNNNNFFGRNVQASGGAVTGSNNMAIGANIPDPTASDQLNINNWILGLSGRLGIGAIVNTFTPTATLDIDSAVGYSHIRMREMAADPTTTNDGNVWHYNDHLWARLNGVNYQLDQQSAGGAGIDDVLAVGQALTTNRTITHAGNILTSTGTSTLYNHVNTNSTATPWQRLGIRTRDNITGATNSGHYIEDVIDNSSGSGVIAAQIGTRWTDATASSEDGQFDVLLATAGAAPTQKLSVTSTGQVVVGVPGATAGSVNLSGSTSGGVVIASDALSNSIRGTTLTGEGVIQSATISMIQTPFSLGDVNTDQPYLDAAQDTWTLQANTLYEFETVIDITTGTASHSLAFGITLAGGASINWIKCVGYTHTAAINANTATFRVIAIDKVSSTVLNAAGAVARQFSFIKGYVSVNAGGTFQPFITFSAAPGGANQTNAGTFFKFTPIGINSTTAVGPIN